MEQQEPYVLVTEHEIVEYDQNPWERLEDDSLWFKAQSAMIYLRKVGE